jgi:hypothetical protein
MATNTIQIHRVLRAAPEKVSRLDELQDRD